jgi:hypothetical protein
MKNKYFVMLCIAMSVAFIMFVSGCVSNPTPTPAITPTSAPTSASTATITTTQVTNISTAIPTTESIKCEICHTNPQNLTPHVNGGKYCINCHGSQVHNIHTGAGTVNLDCQTCHGFPPKIPTVQKGEGPGHYIVCENCHAAPPNNLMPSYGNLVVIHLSRGKYCTNCHGNDIGTIHATAIANLTNRTGG